MSKYYIFTDSDQYDEFEAESVADALSQVDVPSSVVDAATFEGWLERVGGYGEIHEDGVIVACVN